MIGEFAGLTGISIRALRHYDKIGILKPAYIKDSRYRIYTSEDFFRLEQILTLKLLGLSLSEIRQLIYGDEEIDFAFILENQKKVILDKIEYFNLILKAIDRTKAVIKEDNEIKWEEFINIIKVLKMENSKEWIEQFYTKEQLEKIQNRPNAEELAREGQKKWEILVQDIRNNMDKDISSPEVQSLADRWLALIKDFTQGDSGINNSLNNMYSNIDSAPAEFKGYYSQIKGVSEFINKAIALKNKNGIL